MSSHYSYPLRVPKECPKSLKNTFVNVYSTSDVISRRKAKLAVTRPDGVIEVFNFVTFLSLLHVSIKAVTYRSRDRPLTPFDLVVVVLFPSHPASQPQKSPSPTQQLPCH